MIPKYGNWSKLSVAAGWPFWPSIICNKFLKPGWCRRKSCADVWFCRPVLCKFRRRRIFGVFRVVMFFFCTFDGQFDFFSLFVGKKPTQFVFDEFCSNDVPTNQSFEEWCHKEECQAGHDDVGGNPIGNDFPDKRADCRSKSDDAVKDD